MIQGGWIRTEFPSWIARKSGPMSVCSGDLQRFDPGQLAAFEPFEKSPAGGRDIAELVGHAGLGERRYGVAAASDAQQFAGPGQFRRFFRERHRAALERRRLERADRPLPHQGAACLERATEY